MSSAANQTTANRIPANHSRFAFQIPSLKEEVRVVSFSFQGGVSSPYQCVLEVASLRSDLPLADLLGKAAVLTLFDERHPRHIHGEMVSLTQGSVGKRFTSYQVMLRPKLWLLGLRSGMRIFQDKTAVEVVTQVLKEAGIQGQDVRWQVTGSPVTREYCVQYRESDLAFVSRLLEEEGLFYYFEHGLDRHTLVIADSNSVFQPIPGNATLPYRPRSGMVSGEESIYEWYASRQLQSGAVVLRDYGFDKPATRLEGSKSAQRFPELQHYQYPGHFASAAQGKAYASARLQGHQFRQDEMEALSDCPRMGVGDRFSLSQHSTQRFNQEYLVTAANITGKQPQVLEEGASEAGSEFSVQLFAIPAKVAFKPARQFQRPRISGVQTAFVTGPKGEEIYTDRYGRVKVQFLWDREGKHNENSSCWLRTSQAWAGNQWGGMTLPRIGQEVIVSFLNGDPDRPLVTGALYNATSQAPYSLPANKTRTTFKSQSSPGAGGYNELRMEDKKGSEQLFIHGQKDVDLYVKNDRMESIDKDRHRIVKNVANEKVGKDAGNKTGQNRNIKVGQTLSQQVGGNVQQKAGQTWLAKTGADFSLKAGMGVVLDAGMSITLKAGSGTVVLNPAGVSISGSQVRINSGGGAGSAKGASPKAPAAAKPVDPGKPGAAINALGASARFKQQPVKYDESKGKEVDPAALKSLEKTYRHGGAQMASSDVMSGSTNQKTGKTVGAAYSPQKPRKMTSPNSLEEAVALLAVAREQINAQGYIPKYSDDELREMAASGEVPKERFVVRFSTAPKDRKTGAAISPEQNDGPIGHMRDSGRHPLWMSTFDQIENADTDPEIIADVFGTNYDPNQNYVMYVVDLGEDFEENGSDVFVPTFENLRQKLKTEFSGDLSPDLIDEVMTDEYSELFREHWKGFNDQLAAEGKHWAKSFEQDEAELFALTLPENQQEAFMTRQKILSEIGAWEIFTGNGVTEMKSQPGRAGALETLEIQHRPESVKDLLSRGKIVEIPLNPRSM